MATRYVGPGGNDGNSGLTWALRKLTLNGAEDTPVVANDTVYVGPGTYREKLTVDVSGGAGTEIIYIADVTGENTDGIGGIVRITGSDNDQTAARDHCLEANDKDYRIFRGFYFDTPSDILMHLNGGPHDWTIEDCVFVQAEDECIAVEDDDQANFTIRRCRFLIAPLYNSMITFRTWGAGETNAGHLVENCLFVGNGYCVHVLDVGGITVRNCTSVGTYHGVRCISLPGGYTAISVNNCIFDHTYSAVNANVLGYIVENFNTFYACATDRTNVNVGANSETYPPLLLPPILHSGVSQVSGFEFPWWFGMLSEWSQIAAITGSNEPTEDLRGIARPVTASKNSWGATQFTDMERETGTVRTGSVSMCLHDAGRHQIWVPVTATSTTISVYVYREANYAGNNPQMIIKQPGQADDVTTDAAAASQWNLLTTTLTPAADPPYVVVELVSRNTAVALAYETFFDDLVVN